MTKGKERRDQRDFQVSIHSSFWKTLLPLEGTKEAFGVIAKVETLRGDFASTVAWGAYFRGDCSCSLMSEGKRVMLAPSDCLLALVCTTKGEDKSSLGVMQMRTEEIGLSLQPCLLTKYIGSESSWQSRIVCCRIPAQYLKL